MKISTIFCFWLDKTKKKLDALQIKKNLTQINGTGTKRKKCVDEEKSDESTIKNCTDIFCC